MDSIVDAFFPLIDYVEGESKAVDAFLSDPLSHAPTNVNAKVAPSGVGVIAGRRVYDDNVIGIVVEPTSTKDAGAADADASLKRAIVVRQTTTSVLRFLPVVGLSTLFIRLLPASWIAQAPSTEETIMLVDASGFMIPSSKQSRDGSVKIPLGPGTIDGPAIEVDRLAILRRIADARKLVTGLSRLLGPKSDVVRGVRKRLKEETGGGGRKMFGSGDHTHDISIYFEDLFGAPVCCRFSRDGS